MTTEEISFLKKILGSFEPQKDELLFKCGFCKKITSKKKLSLNIKNNTWKCWHCDTKGAGIANLLFALKLYSARKEYLQAFGKTKKQKNDVVEQKEDFKPSLPKDYIPISSFVNSSISRPIKYLNSRNITIETACKYNLGFCMEGTYKDRIIIPSFDCCGDLNFFTGRTINSSDINYLNDILIPKNYKNSIILNELNLDFSKELFLVEGFFDMMNCDKNTCPLFGSTLSRDSLLFSKIVKNNTEVTVILDADAFDKSIAICEKLLECGINTNIIIEDGVKDLGKASYEYFKLISYPKKIKATKLILRRMKITGYYNNI